jgi:hypothetical protein
MLSLPIPAVRPGKLCFVYCATALLLSACASDGRKPVYPTHGQVFDKQHQPAVGALVVFHPAAADDADLNKPRAYVEEDGSFALTTYTQGDGAPEGEYIVTVVWPAAGASPFGPNKQGADRLKGRYASAKDSKLHFKVEKQAENVLQPIQLE